MNSMKPVEREELIDLRYELRLVIWDLIIYLKANRNELEENKYLRNVFAVVTGVAFSLWRAGFLLTADRAKNGSVLTSSTKMLKQIIDHNFVYYKSDVSANAWTSGYYLGSGMARLREIEEKVGGLDHLRKFLPKQSLDDFRADFRTLSNFDLLSAWKLIFNRLKLDIDAFKIAVEQKETWNAKEKQERAQEQFSPPSADNVKSKDEGREVAARQHRVEMLMCKLVRFAERPEANLSDPHSLDVFSLRVGTATSLWYALPLIESDRGWKDIFDAAEKILKAVAINSTVNAEVLDKTRSWSVGYYLNNAITRIHRVHEREQSFDQIFTDEKGKGLGNRNVAGIWQVLMTSAESLGPH